MTRAAAALLAAALLVPGEARAEGRPPKRTATLAAILDAAPSARHLAWVFLADKGDAAQLRAASAAPVLTPRAASRRRLRGSVRDVTFDDLPLPGAYVEAVRARVAKVRHVSRWLNAVSVEGTPEELRAVEALPFVARLDAVRRHRQRPEPIEREDVLAAAGARGERPLDYGTSLGQVQQIRVPEVHDMGLSGEGVIVAVFDSGFSTLAHESFAAMSILATRDFVNGDDDVTDHGDVGTGSHGTMTLSVLGGYRPGQLIGPAYGASFLLAKTENTASETPAEEDNWAAAAEWAESLGADVISSSLGYLRMDPGFPGYTAADMDGDTAISTRAADMAAERGVVVVNSAGNSGFHPAQNTIGAPADGHLVIAVGAVTAAGARSSFSSVGPSADGRIKPDVMAQGSAVKVASPTSPSGYGAANGTSFSCPLTAGVVALVLEANPALPVPDLVAVLRHTASRAEAPDRLLGWGIVDARGAVETAVAMRDGTPAAAAR